MLVGWHVALFVLGANVDTVEREREGREGGRVGGEGGREGREGREGGREGREGGRGRGGREGGRGRGGRVGEWEGREGGRKGEREGREGGKKGRKKENLGEKGGLIVFFYGKVRGKRQSKKHILIFPQPENLLLYRKSSLEIKIVDFGLAVQLQEGQEMKSLVGTAEYVCE